MKFVELLGTVDFVLSDETVVFRTCDIEREKVIFQMVNKIKYYDKKN